MAGQSFKPKEEEKDETRSYEIMPEDAPYEDGFSLRTVIAALFVGFIMLPGAIYLGLVTGQTMAGAAQWVTLILFIEIAKRSFIQLKTQEIILIYWVAGGLVVMGGKLGTGADLFGGPFGGKIWDQYLVQSPQADGLAQYVPAWLTPPRGSEALMARSFFHRDWLVPIGVLVAYIGLFQINSLSLGYVLFRVTSDIERLEFPMAPVQAGGATALAETSGKKEGWRWQMFSIGSFIGIIWGLLYVVVPTLSEVFLTDTVQVLPIPFIDFTNSIKAVVPAAIFGVGTDLLNIFWGFVLPFWVIVGSFLGSMSVNFIVNPILYSKGILHTWTPGMTAIPTLLSNDLDFWISFSIGTAVLVMFIGFLMIGKSFRKMKADNGALSSPSTPEGRGDIAIWKALAVWALSTVGFVVLVHFLVPEFPWWITTVFGFVYTPLSSYIAARMIGLAGQPYGSSIPFLRESVFILSGYKGAALWFAPVPMFDHSGQVNTFKQLELTKTRFSGIVKVTILTFVVMMLCSLLFWSLIWKLGPIPSSSYPFVQKMWPFHSTMQAIWAKSTLPGGRSMILNVIRAKYIFAGFGTGALLYGLLSLVGAPVLIFYGVIGGVMQWPHYIILQFLGAMLGRYYFRKRFGKEQWRAYAPILLAGYSCGMGLISMASIAIALIAKAVSHVVF
ncbi:MAG: peptide transporter [Candidatus Latescibacterota bacterium]